MVVLASLYTLWLSHTALGPGQLNCPEAGHSRGWSWSLVEPVPESLEPVDMSEVLCAVSSRGCQQMEAAVVGVMMEVSPVSELPRVLTQENDLWLQKIKTSKQQTQSL